MAAATALLELATPTPTRTLNTYASIHAHYTHPNAQLHTSAHAPAQVLGYRYTTKDSGRLHSGDRSSSLERQLSSWVELCG